MGLHALRAALQALGHSVAYDTLAVVSGEAFACAWDATGVVEPLRDVRALPVLRTGAMATGAALSWHSLDDPRESLNSIRAALRDGALALAPVLAAGHGYAVITALDEDGAASIVAPSGAATPPTMNLSAGWTGSPLDGARWLVNPLAIVRAGSVREADGAAVPAIARAMLESRSLSYEVSPALRQAPGAPPQAAECQTGLAGLAALANELQGRPDLSEPTRLGRLHTQLGQITHGFELTWRWLQSPAAQGLAAAPKLARRARSVRGMARELEERFWDPNGQASPQALGRAVSGRKSLVFALPVDLDPAQVPGAVVELIRGRAVVVVSGRRWQAVGELAALLVDGVRAFATLLAEA